MTERHRFRQHILGVASKQVDKELILGLAEHLDDVLVTRVVHIDVELAKEHHELLSLRVLLPILVHHRLLEEVL